MVLIPKVPWTAIRAISQLWRCSNSCVERRDMRGAMGGGVGPLPEHWEAWRTIRLSNTLVHFWTQIKWWTSILHFFGFRKRLGERWPNWKSGCPNVDHEHAAASATSRRSIRASGPPGSAPGALARAESCEDPESLGLNVDFCCVKRIVEFHFGGKLVIVEQLESVLFLRFEPPVASARYFEGRFPRNELPSIFRKISSLVSIYPQLVVHVRTIQRPREKGGYCILKKLDVKGSVQLKSLSSKRPGFALWFFRENAPKNNIWIPQENAAILSQQEAGWWLETFCDVKMFWTWLDITRLVRYRLSASPGDSAERVFQFLGPGCDLQLQVTAELSFDKAIQEMNRQLSSQVGTILEIKIGMIVLTQNLVGSAFLGQDIRDETSTKSSPTWCIFRPKVS